MTPLRFSCRLRQAALATAVAAVVAVVLPAGAGAHASFLDSNPAPGLRLETGPAQIALDFTEPLNSQLSSASLSDVSSGDPIPAQTSISGSRLVLQPQTRLGKAVYRVQWHSVSSEDGHSLEGSFGFGVQVTPTLAAEQSVEQSPVAGGGWLRMIAHGAMYALLLLFAGGVLNGAILGPRARPGEWLLSPAAATGVVEAPGATARPAAERLWARTVSVGWLALAAAIAAALLDAANAGGGLSPHDLSAYLLSNESGLARVAMIASLGSAALAAGRRLPYAAAASLVISFGALAFGGHANSADPRLLAILTDWLHLVAAAIWIGGIAQLAWAWLPRITSLSAPVRQAVMRSVLARFGRVALPAFLVVVASGLANALIELGHPAALWQTGYGRVLAVKMFLVALIALASYNHALRLRPRLLAANPHPDTRLERRHWRLLGVEPWLGLGAIAAVAVLVAFPLPPRQLGSASRAEASIPCEPFCPLPNASVVQLPVATHAGSDIAAFWLQREGRELVGTMRLLDLNLKPVAASVEVNGQAQAPCSSGSVGCWEISGKPAGGRLTAMISDSDGTREVSVPAVWREGGNRKARAVLARAQRAMRRLRSAQMRESVTSGLGQTVRTHYRFKAPDRMEYLTNGGAHLIAIRKTSWESVHGAPYKRSPFGGPGPEGGVQFAQFFRWTIFGNSVRWLGANSREIHIAFFDQASPIWYRLTINRATDRVLREQMIAQGHFMTRRWFDFNEPVQITPPR
jgi:copper transport protein